MCTCSSARIKVPFTQKVAHGEAYRRAYIFDSILAIGCNRNNNALVLYGRSSVNYVMKEDTDDCSEPREG